MTTSAHQPRRTASDGLMMQVTEANVLQLQALYEAQRIQLENALRDSRQDAVLKQPGGDPISRDYTPDFQVRITTVVALHERESRELDEVSSRLTEAAREYGHSEFEIAESFRRAYPHLAPAPLRR